MENKSVWGKVIREHAQLVGDIDRDIVIIGGGIAGLLTAYKLTAVGKRVTLIEADALLSGVTARTTAKVTAHHGDIYADIMKSYGLDVARRYYKSQCDGIDEYKRLIREKNIDCE